ncbi:hypothetical protein FV241_02425 [Methylobacterium sp. WL2]|nr:hypothetical protein FVA80_01985 [Methylobacterium sp. WL1]TXN59386.1 hypothetical protein FV241_02425 [Methylobacterium sp. WL2]
MIPGGDFLLDDTISFDAPGLGIKIYGSDLESRLIFSGGMQNGLVCNARSVTLEGFRAIATNTPGMNGAGSLIYVRNAAPLGSEFENISIRDLGLEGRPGSDPLYFLALQNPAFARIDGVGIVAFENESYGSKGNAGIYIFGETASNASAVGDFTVHGANVYGVETGILVSGGTGDNGAQTVEGCSFTDCVVQGARIGLHMQASGYKAPGHSWKGGHINCDGVAIQLDSWAQFKISDALFYLNAGSARKQGHILLNNCTEINVHDMHLLHFATVAGQPATGVGNFGVAFAGSTDLCQVHDVDCYGFAGGSAAVYNAGGGGANRAHHVGKQGGQTILAGSVQDLGGNHAL